MSKTVVTLVSRRNAKIDPVVLQWAQNLPEEFVECRDMSHNWISPRRGIPTYLLWEVQVVDGRREYRRTVKCSRCGFKRIDRKEYSTGIRLHPYYEPPEPKAGQSEYYLPAGHGRLSPAELFRITQALSPAQTKPAKTATRRRSPQKKGA